MFGLSFKSRKPPAAGEMMGLKRNFSTEPINYHLNFDLNINAQKRFSNPNFVNKHNPNLLKRSHSEPMKISASKEPPEEIGGVPSSPICIAVSKTPNEITISITPENFARKTRLNSDCASEDSFIIFECDSNSDYDDTTEEDDDDSDEELCSDEESDVDEVDFVKKVPFKKVRFCEKPLIHPMIKWDYAYRAARKGPWEQHMRDRCRFENRVSKLAEVISPVLNATHRTNVYNERFRDQNRSDTK
nr:uncharacterized protein LOC111428939 [Onthophagus taurus]